MKQVKKIVLIALIGISVMPKIAQSAAMEETLRAQVKSLTDSAKVAAETTKGLRLANKEFKAKYGEVSALPDLTELTKEVENLSKQIQSLNKLEKNWEKSVDTSLAKAKRRAEVRAEPGKFVKVDPTLVAKAKEAVRLLNQQKEEAKRLAMEQLKTFVIVEFAKIPNGSGIEPLVWENAVEPTINAGGDLNALVAAVETVRDGQGMGEDDISKEAIQGFVDALVTKINQVIKK